MNAATKLPGELGPIHFVGIGGIGMSGIAEVLMTLGYRVQGSDAKRSKITDRLETLGATVFEGQRAENLGEAGVVVISTAIKKGNPELEEARRRGLTGGGEGVPSRNPVTSPKRNISPPETRWHQRRNFITRARSERCSSRSRTTSGRRKWRPFTAPMSPCRPT